jgi:hypothetical protein
VEAVMTRLLDPIDLATNHDDGCRYWDACLTCPFAQCVFEAPEGPRRAALRLRNALMRARHATGEDPDTIARRFRVGRATVYRALRPPARRGVTPR